MIIARRHPNLRPILLPLFLAALVIGVAVLWVTRQPSAQEPLQVAYVRAGDLYRMALEGGSEQPLTQSGGKLLDYTVSRDGQALLYTVWNAAGGTDLWHMDRQGRHPRKLVDCGEAVCNEPVFSPDASQVAYSKNEHGDMIGRPFLLDVQSGQVKVLLPDPEGTSLHLAWSPDGKRLAFLDGRMQAVRVVEPAGGEEVRFGSRVVGGVSWSPDGQRLLYLEEVDQDGFASVQVRAAQLDTGEVKTILAGDSGDEDFGFPSLSPDGTRLVVGQRTLHGSPSKQVYLYQADGSAGQAVTSDVTVTHAAVQWSPDGKLLAFQRYAFGASSNQPEVVIWNLNSGELRVLAENASQPKWLP